MKLYQNKVKLTINGKEFTNNIPFPIKWNELLDSQLDEASIELLQIEESSFMHLSEAKLEVWNEQDPSRVLAMHYLIASDNANEIPSGSGKFNHSLSLVERTKWLERFVCRSQGYVNPLQREFTQISAEAQYVKVFTSEPSGWLNFPSATDKAKMSIGSPLKTGEIVLPSWRQMTEKVNTGPGSPNYSLYDGYVEVKNPSTETIAKTENLDDLIVFEASFAGPYVVTYRIERDRFAEGDWFYTTYEIKFYFAVLD
jgi:hypothetical protein